MISKSWLIACTVDTGTPFCAAGKQNPTVSPQPLGVKKQSPSLRHRRCQSAKRPHSSKPPHKPVRNRRPVDLGERGIPFGPRRRLHGLDIGGVGLIQRQSTRHSPFDVLLPNALSLLAAGEIALFARHDLSGMDDVEEHEGDEHESGVEDVLVCFVDWDAGAVVFGVLYQAEDDADLGPCESSVCLRWLGEEWCLQ